VDSSQVVHALYEVDPEFVDLCEVLFGKSLDPQQAWDVLYGPDGVSKMMPAPADVRAPSAPPKGRLKPVAAPASAPKTGMPRAVAPKTQPKTAASSVAPMTMGKSDIEWAGEISKVDTDKRQVFGWASVVAVNGEPVVDRQGDLIEPDEMERAAYEYVMKSRTGSVEHRRDGDAPFVASEMIESLVITPEKIEKMGLPEDMPIGWWVGFKVHDDKAWADVKEGKLTGFSVHGSGKRQPIHDDGF